MRKYKTSFTKEKFIQTAIPGSQSISHIISVQGKSGHSKKEFRPAELQDHLLQENCAHKCKQERSLENRQLLAQRLKLDGQRRVLVSTFEDAVKSMEFCCSGCFSEHSTLSALTPKIAT